MLDIFMGQPDVESNERANLARMTQAVPLGRAGAPLAGGQAALFLVSGDASHITGVALPVGGHTAG